MRARFLFGIVFLLLQVSGIVYARFSPERFFCWAPYDSHTQFETFVTIDNKKLKRKEAEARYKYKMIGWEQRSINNIFSLISQYEDTYGKDDHAKVMVRYSTNGHDEKEWTYKR